MKILLIIMIVILAFGLIGTVGFMTQGFSSWNMNSVKDQISNLTDKVQNLTNDIKDAINKVEQANEQNAPEDENGKDDTDGEGKDKTNENDNGETGEHKHLYDDNGVCKTCGQCGHLYIFNDVCEGCGKTLEQIQAECEHVFDGCVCTKCRLATHDVDPDTYECRKCGMLVINVNSLCMGGHDLDIYGRCTICGREINPIVDHSILECKNHFYVGESISDGDIVIGLTYQDGTSRNLNATADMFENFDTSTVGYFTTNFIFDNERYPFEYWVEEEQSFTGEVEPIIDGEDNF